MRWDSAGEGHRGRDLIGKLGRSFLFSFLNRRHLLLLQPWACGPRVSVVQAKRHVHSLLVERASCPRRQMLIGVL